jgi:hypothetical protein
MATVLPDLAPPKTTIQKSAEIASLSEIQEK